MNDGWTQVPDSHDRFTCGERERATDEGRLRVACKPNGYLITPFGNNKKPSVTACWWRWNLRVVLWPIKWSEFFFSYPPPHPLPLTSVFDNQHCPCSKRVALICFCLFFSFIYPYLHVPSYLPSFLVSVFVVSPVCDLTFLFAIFPDVAIDRTKQKIISLATTSTLLSSHVAESLNWVKCIKRLAVFTQTLPSRLARPTFASSISTQSFVLPLCRLYFYLELMTSSILVNLRWKVRPFFFVVFLRANCTVAYRLKTQCPKELFECRVWKRLALLRSFHFFFFSFNLFWRFLFFLVGYALQMFFGFFVVFFFAYFLKKNCSRAAALAFHLALRQRRRGTVDSCPCTHYVVEQLSFLLFVVSDTNVLSLASRSATNHNHQPPTTSIKTQTSRCRKLSGVRTCPPTLFRTSPFFCFVSSVCVCATT